MIEFILNNQKVQTSATAGSTLLDFVRYQQQLLGTKIGCREGDCGACTLLMGELDGDQVIYKSLTSCITPLGNAHGKHIVSIEGLNQVDRLTPYQTAMVEESGTQCGFCTVGFIVSFAGECLAPRKSSYDDLISAIDGNICRCTGYKSIERAAAKVQEQLDEKDLNNLLPWLAERHFIPAYFKAIPQQLKALQAAPLANGNTIVGGGTDLLVQKHDAIAESEVYLISDNKHLVGIRKVDQTCIIGAATNTTQLLESNILNEAFPNLRQHLKLVSSTPIRNIGTLAGNLVNASPIGDLTAFFLALNSELELSNDRGDTRSILLKDFYLGYKILDKKPEEFISRISFTLPDKNTYFNFEKVSKRRYLDIASVNTAISYRLVDNKIESIHASAGGVGPTPKYLSDTCAFLKGKSIDEPTLSKALYLLRNEISPISDARGSKEYKTLLLEKLFYAHFVSSLAH